MYLHEIKKKIEEIVWITTIFRLRVVCTFYQTYNIMNIKNITRLLLTLWTIAGNIYAVQAPLFWISTGDLSDMLATLITPAWTAFSIWSLIYLWLLALSVYVLLKKVPISGKQLALYVVSSCANVWWLVAWHGQNLLIAFILMVVLLWSLIALVRSAENTGKKRWLFHSVFSLYLWWITVATLIMTVVYFTYGLSLFSATNIVIPAILLWVVALFQIVIILIKRNFIIPAVTVRAYARIIVASDVSTIQYVAGGWVAVLAVFLLVKGVGYRN